MTAKIFRERKCTNPLTGRRTWLLRHVPAGVEGYTADWVVTATVPSWRSKEAEMSGLCGVMGSDRQAVRQQIADLKAYLVHEMCFEKVRALRKGRWVYY